MNFVYQSHLVVTFLVRYPCVMVQLRGKSHSDGSPKGVHRSGIVEYPRLEGQTAEQNSIL